MNSTINKNAAEYESAAPRGENLEVANESEAKIAGGVKLAQGSRARRVLDVYESLGYDAILLILIHCTKIAVRKGWQNTPFAETQTPAYQELLAANDIGVLLGRAGNGIFTLDCDTDEAADRFTVANPNLSKTLRTRGARGCNLWFVARGDIPCSCRLFDNGEPIGELRSDGNYTKICGIHPDTGNEYEWLNDAPAAGINFDEINWPEGWSGTCIASSSARGSEDYRHADFAHFGTTTYEEAREALSFIPKRPEYFEWLRIASAVFSAFPFDAAFELLNEWSPEEKPGEYRQKYKARLKSISIGTLFHYARSNGLSRPPKSAAKPYTLWQPSKFVAFTPDPSSNLLGDGFLQLGEYTSLVGIGGLGKTRLVTCLAICQITGREWCGLPTRGLPQKWVLLSTESSLARWKSDLELMLASLNEDERAAVDSNLFILALTPDEEASLNLGDPESISRLESTLRQGVGVLVLDPFADMIDGDENQTADVVRTLRCLRKVHREVAPNAACLIVHHGRTGALNIAQAGDNYASGNFGRGSKALYSRVRCELQLAPGDREDPNKLVLACGKANDCKKFEARGIVFDPQFFHYTVDPTFDVSAWRADVAGKNSEGSASIADVVGAVREASQSGGDVATGAIVGTVRMLTGSSSKTIQRRLNDATKHGYLLSGSKRGFWKLGPKPLIGTQDTVPDMS